MATAPIVAPLRSLDSGQRDWMRSNELQDQARFHRSEIIAARDAMSRADKVDFDDVIFHPFKIYRFPIALRVAPNYANASQILAYRVHGGRYNGVLTLNTDQHDSDPNGANYPRFPDSEAMPNEGDCADILIPVNTHQYWFWVDCSSPASPLVKSGTPGQTIVGNAGDPATNGWPNLPNSSPNVLPIGWVDVATDAANNQPFIRQLVRTDLLPIGSGGNGGGLNWRGIYSNIGTYHQFDITVVQSGNSQGVWIKTTPNTMTGVDPAWPMPNSADWFLWTLGVYSQSVCANGSSKTQYFNATPPS